MEHASGSRIGVMSGVSVVNDDPSYASRVYSRCC